jgi:hypothetical protein
MKEFPKEIMEKTIKNIRKKYKEIKTVETVKNKLLGVQVKNQSASVKSYAIQFTGEDANIYKIFSIISFGNSFIKFIIMFPLGCQYELQVKESYSLRPQNHTTLQHNH